MTSPRMEFPTGTPPIKEYFTLSIPDGADWIAPVRGALLDLVEEWSFDATKVDIETVTREYLDVVISLSKGIPMHDHDSEYSPISHVHERYEIWDSANASIGIENNTLLRHDRLRWRTGSPLTVDGFPYPKLLETGFYYVEVNTAISASTANAAVNVFLGDTANNPANGATVQKFLTQVQFVAANGGHPCVAAGFGYFLGDRTIGIGLSHELSPWPNHFRGYGFLKITKIG